MKIIGTSMNDQERFELAQKLSHALYCTDDPEAAVQAHNLDPGNAQAWVDAVKGEHPDADFCTSAQCQRPDAR